MQTLLWKSNTVKPARWEYCVLALVAGLLIVLTTLGVVVSKRSDDPVKVSNRFIHALLSGDVGAAYDLTAEPYRQTTNDESFESVAAQFSMYLKTNPQLEGHRIERSDNGNLFATVEYSVPGTLDRRLVVKLTQENETWRVLNINNTL